MKTLPIFLFPIFWEFRTQLHFQLFTFRVALVVWQQIWKVVKRHVALGDAPELLHNLVHLRRCHRLSFCCDRKSRAANLRTAAASNNRDHASLSLLLLLARATHIHFCSSRASRSWWITQSTQHHRRGCNTFTFYAKQNKCMPETIGHGKRAK